MPEVTLYTKVLLLSSNWEHCSAMLTALEQIMVFLFVVLEGHTGAPGRVLQGFSIIASSQGHH